MSNEIENASFLDEKVALSKGAAINPWADTSLLFRREPLPVPTGERRISVFKRPDMAGYLSARRGADGETFTALCYAHGQSLFDAARGGCLACEQSVASCGLPAAKVAELIGADHYDDTCEKHGLSLFHMRSGKCRKCAHEASGRPLEHGNARAAARRANRTEYAEVCAMHGETAHSVLRGKCLRCYNSAGYPRKS
jgi:hypothetical protein